MTRAMVDDVVVAESEDVVVVDGYTYFPRADVDERFLVPSDHTSVCGWKGTASYHSVVVDGTELRDAAFEYRSPKPAAAHVEGRVAFWRGVRIEEEDATSEVRPGPLRRLVGRRTHSEAPATESGPTTAGLPQLDDAGFAAATRGGWTIVDFWAPWCGPCQAFEPLFEQAARHAPDAVRFARCEVDANPVTATAFDILTVPTVVLLGPDGAEVDRVVGVPTHQELQDLVERAAAHLGV